MKGAAIVALTLSCQGFWFGGRSGRVEIGWAQDVPPPPATLSWRLMLGEAEVSRGETGFSAAPGAPQHLGIALPPLRAHASLTWRWKLGEAAGGRVLAEGTAAVHAFAHDILAPWAERLRAVPARIVVCDASGRLPEILSARQVPHLAVARAAQVAGVRADLIVVGPGQLAGDPEGEAALLRAVRAGASAMVFEQTRPRVLGHAARPRRPPEPLVIAGNHPLLRGLDAEALGSWLSGVRDVWPVSPAPGRAAQALLAWPTSVSVHARPEPQGLLPSKPLDERQAGGGTTSDAEVPREALLLSEALGAGWLVLCQLPIERWSEDPRGQVLLDNALDYLLSSREPIQDEE
jgi:hypothetical protein